MSNRLASELSPYLRQHADNPVDWYPWGEEAFERAEAEDKPIFLSIGYSSCHWCHVMAHESFENDEVAEILNRSFVSIKLDREERPDVDDGYMAFVQMLSGRGGWPMSLFLMPDGAPFHGGTYFPLHDRGQTPGFRSLLLSIEKLWKDRRGDLAEAAQYHRGVIGEAMSASADSGEPGIPTVESLLERIREGFDPEEGGFGSSPKFPPHAALELLLALDPSDRMALQTLDAMARGGIHDHVGGGFHRYSTDGAWHLPHFEKMLYDNALLMKSYSQTGLEPFKAVAKQIVSWLVREMRSPDGLFYAALDADSEGEEGKFYTWKRSELLELPDGDAFAAVYQCTEEGNFRDEATGRLTGENVLHLRPTLFPLRDELKTLRERRSLRVRPQLDDKALVGWNGLTISGLVAAGYETLATECAWALLKFEVLPRYVSGGQPVGEGFLDDYAYLALGLYDLGLEPEALELGRRMISLFYDESEGGFFATSEDHEPLFGRTKPVFDQPIPSPNAAAIRVLIRMGDLDRAERSLRAFSGWMQRAPLACEGLFMALRDLESAGAHLGPEFRVVGLENGLVQVAVDLPHGWQLNPLVDGSLLRATLDGEQVNVEVAAEGASVAFSGELVLEYQLCSERECLQISRRRIVGGRDAYTAQEASESAEE